MSSTRTRRLKKVGQRLESTPIAPNAVNAAFTRFSETGELPDHLRLAHAVTRKALYACEQEASPGQAATWIREVHAQLVFADHAFAHRARCESAGPARFKPLSLREALFNEAVHDSKTVRQPARAALKALVVNGGDATDPQLVADDMTALGSGTVGQHVLAMVAGDDKQPPPGAARELLAQAREDDRSWSPEGDGSEMSDEERAARIKALLAVAEARAASSVAGEPVTPA